MEQYVSGLIEIVSSNQYAAYVVVFFLAMSEAVPIVGVVVPGSTLLVAVSALLPSGAISFWPLFGSMTLGGIAGDGLAYWLGRHYHRDIVRYWPFRRYPQLIRHGEAFFDRHGGKSVFLARFVAGVRAVVPLVAGILQMPVRQFYTVNLVSAVLWSLSNIVPGLLIGASLALAGAVAARLAVFVALLAGVLWLTALALRLALHHGGAIISIAQERLLAWAKARDSWVRRQTLALLDPDRKELKGLAWMSLLLVGALWLFFGILEDVVSGDPLVQADAAVYNFLRDLRTPWGDHLMVAIAALGDGIVTIAVAAAVLVWLVWWRNGRGALYWVLAIAGSSLIAAIMRQTLHTPRPFGIEATAFSFPSGHVTVSTVLYGFLAVLVARELRPHWAAAVVAAASVVAVMIAFSRLYLGVHNFSDVAGGLAFGATWLLLLAVAYIRHRPSDVGAHGMLLSAVAAMAMAGGLHVSEQYSVDLQRYAVRPEGRTISLQDWETTAWQGLSARRLDLGGGLEEPLTIQWLGGLDTFQEHLVADGWRVPVRWTFPAALSWISPTTAPLALPVLPQLHDGRRASLTLVRAITDDDPLGARLVLRLWSPGVGVETCDGSLETLWVGNAVTQRFSRPFAQLTFGRATGEANSPREAVAAALPSARLAQRSDLMAESTWDGKVLLARDPANRKACPPGPTKPRGDG